MKNKAHVEELRFKTFPRFCPCSLGAKKVVECFKRKFADVNSYTHKRQESNEVLAKVCSELQSCCFQVETGKKKSETIPMPVLIGDNDRPEQTFLVDAYSEDYKTVVEIEAGQAVVNHRFLKDIFEACQMPQVEHLVIAVRNIYDKSDDFKKVCTFLETLYVNGRLVLPLKSITVIGY